MPISNIRLDVRAPKGHEINYSIVLLREHIDKIKQLKNQMDAMTDGVDYAEIELMFGVPLGKGQPLYNLVAGANAELAAATNLRQLLNWLVPKPQ